MRLNKFLAHSTGMSRRQADEAIASGRVFVNDQTVSVGQDVSTDDVVKLDGQVVSMPTDRIKLILNKPRGYVSSRRAQAKNVKTVYELLPSQYQHLKSVGRLDKDSSGLLLFTNDGDLAHQLTHPSFHKTKRYIVRLNAPLAPLHQQMISDFGIQLPDGPSKLSLERNNDNRTEFIVTMHEGRNRQIRRTFAALGYTVIYLHRTDFGNYHLGDLPSGKYQIL